MENKEKEIAKTGLKINVLHTRNPLSATWSLLLGDR
jgi:hypothetical protein